MNVRDQILETIEAQTWTPGLIMSDFQRSSLVTRLFNSIMPILDDAIWEPTRWWRVIDPDGRLWCETSSESEARAAVRPGDRLERLWSKTESEWRPA